jgi:putative endonuclease
MAYHVYILTNHYQTVLYTGITGDLVKRVYQHKKKLLDGFTKKYNVDRLIYFEETNDVQSAIAREKQLKGWRRSRKVDLINTINPDWQDLSKDWYDQ